MSPKLSSQSQRFMYIWIVFGFVTLLTAEQKDKDLHILGLFPISGTAWPCGYATKTAAEMAIEDINKRSDILSQHKLHLHAVDTMVSFLTNGQS